MSPTPPVREYLVRAVDTLAMFLIAAMAGMVFLQVIYRYVVGAPLTWPEELARLCLVWVTYLGAYTVMYRGEHLALTVLTDRLRPAPKAVVTVAAHLTVLVFLAVVTIFGVSFLRAMGSSQMPVSGIPYAVAYGVVWLASLMMCVEIVIRLCGDVREAKKIYPKEAQ